MKRKSILLLVFFISTNIYSQSLLNNYELGYYHDINDQTIDGYFDIDYDLGRPLSLSYTTGDDYTPGFYYDLKNNKISGLIKYSQSSTFFKFKGDKNSKEKNVGSDECTAYVVGADSFAVIENFKVQRDLSGLKSVDRDFAEVIEKVGNLTFYKHTRIFINNVITTYLAKADSSKNYITFPKGFNQFKNSSVPIFGEFRSLRDQITAEKYTDDDIPVMAKLLKYKRKYDHQERILYNSSWDEVDDAGKSFYYATILSLKDSIFHLAFHFNNGVPIYEGHFISFFPYVKTGEFIWYYPNGTVRKKINYTDDKPTKTTTYFRNGNVHYEYKLLKKTLSYSKVLATNGSGVLNDLGCGVEVFYDSIAGRQITNEFIKNKLVRSYFEDSDSKKIYQFCDKNARIKFFGDLRFRLGKKDYPVNSLKSFTHGCVLIKCIVEPSGATSKIQILKGIDSGCDSLAMALLSYVKTGKQWDPGKNQKEKVAQELVIPIDFSIKSFSRYRNNYYNNSWMLQQQMMRPQIIKIPQQNMPTYRF